MIDRLKCVLLFHLVHALPGLQVPSPPYPVPCVVVILEALTVMFAGQGLPIPYLTIGEEAATMQLNLVFKHLSTPPAPCITRSC